MITITQSHEAKDVNVITTFNTCGSICTGVPKLSKLFNIRCVRKNDNTTPAK